MELRGPIAADNKTREVARAIVSFCFGKCQPDRADVFGWIDDNADELAAFILQQTKLK